MREIVFATNNQDKLKEIRELVHGQVRILCLSEIGCKEELPETHETIEENAAEKALFVYQKYGFNCFSDDTGLEVEALNNAPGVYSARYAGPGKDFNANIDLVLRNLEGKKSRRARFRTVIALIEEGKIKEFEGVANGEILTQKEGSGGFGYDPVFKPEGLDQTFASMTLEDKNKISHRGKAVRKLVEYIATKITQASGE